jgi:hypothetical protein
MFWVAGTVFNVASPKMINPPHNPVIFTGEADQLDGAIPATTTGLWGGLIILGDATLNTVPATQNIEGITRS